MCDSLNESELHSYRRKEEIFYCQTLMRTCMDTKERKRETETDRDRERRRWMGETKRQTKREREK